jgi:hypothetical protein
MTVFWLEAAGTADMRVSFELRASAFVPAGVAHVRLTHVGVRTYASPDISPRRPRSHEDAHPQTISTCLLLGTLSLRGYAVSGPFWTAISAMPVLPIE